MVEGAIEIPVIFIMGYGDIPMTVKAMKAGAVELLTKPFRDQVLDAVREGWSATARRGSSGWSLKISAAA